uniref:Plastocyanin/azurin family copper binding protein n=1 Tax=Marseillevirus LCMAC201 TaxID=2506605 RepID=A0A481YVT2_9VIRU|nr:MAG: plastocyanin/azurin family copper binding protein [Marseillevirus LCMAC201]
MNIFIIVFITLFLILCWGTPTEGITTNFKVSIVDIGFKPVDITIKVGDTVIWSNEDPIWHTVTSGEPLEPNGIFNSERLNSGDTFKYTFNEIGKYPYYCIPHPWMIGTIIVK